MTAYEFFCLVEWMRNKQKEYDHTLGAKTLKTRKWLEGRVDDEIRRVRNLVGRNDEAIKSKFNLKP